MIRIVEKTTPIKMKPLAYLKYVNHILVEMSILLRQLSFKLAEEFIGNAIYFQEGTPKDKAFIEDKIKKLQLLVNQLDKALMLLEQPCKDFNEIQRELNLAMSNSKAIHQHMIDIWRMRNKGKTANDNSKIQSIVKVLFNNVNEVLRQIDNYVVEYNKLNNRKFVFRIKWTPLPK